MKRIPRKPLGERFWSKVLIGDGCWEWQGSLTRKGYGQYALRGLMYRAHRLSYTEMVGAFSPALQIMHMCDNRKCVRPSHLRPGTNLENAIDRELKGRSVILRGAANGRATLTAETVLAIRAEVGLSLNALARKYNSTKRTIHHIRQRTTWKHV